MLEKLIAFSLTQRLVILGLSLAIAVAGVFALLRLPIDAFPEIAPTQVKIIMKAPGMTPEEVETRVVRPLELELLGIPRQTIMRAMTKYAIADITIDFEDGVDVYWARQQVAERLAKVQPDLPETVEGGLAPISTALSELFMFTIDGGDISLEERRSLLDWVIRPALRTVPGVADVNSLGGRVRTITVAPNEAVMAEVGVSMGDLTTAIARNNRNDGAGRFSMGEEALVVRSIGAVTGLDDIAGLVVAEKDGTTVRVSDVADVSIGALTRYGSVTKDGLGEAVQGIVVALRGADARMVVSGVEERLKELSDGFPEGVEAKVFYSRSDLINEAVSTVTQALIIASVLVIVLLLLFLNNFRAALVVTLILPFCALATFLLMDLAGMSANLMSLGGLAIAIGMIVDGAIVVTENAVEKLRGGAKSKLNAIYRAACEVAAPTVAGTLVICLVFVPLLTLEGLEGKLFSPVAQAIIFALGAAMVFSLTLIPVLASYLLSRKEQKEPWLMRQITPGFESVLGASLARPIIIYGLAAISVVLAGLAYIGVGKTFMPTMNEGAVVMQAAALPTINLQQSEADDLRLEAALIENVPEITNVISRVGSDELGLDPMSLNESDMFLELLPRDQWRGPDTEWLVGEMRAVMADFIGIETAFTQPIEMRVSEMLTGARGDVAVKVFGPDADTLADLSGQIEAILADVPGAVDVATTSNDVSEYLQIDLDAQRLGRFGFDVLAVQDVLRARLEGLKVGEVIEPGRRTPIIIRAQTKDAAAAFADMRLVANDGQQVLLSDLATIDYVEGLASTDRENGSRYGVVEAFVSGRDLVGFVDDARAAVSGALDLPTGYRLEWGGEFENQQRAATQLSLMIPLSLALIFGVLFLTLRSLRQATLILANIPFALVGGIIALSLSGQYLSVPASVGFIALLGVAVLNGLVLITHFNELRALGHSMEDAVRRGTVRRLRPVLMTATTAAFGLMPLLFATGPGSEIQRPLATVVIGGLVSSTMLTLLLLPLLYRRFGIAKNSLVQEGEVRWITTFAS